MNNQPITEVTSHKHLGLVFCSDCTWHDHFEHIKAKAWARINVMRKLKFQLDRKSLQIIYFSFIRPLLQYGDVVWSNCTLYESNELENIQHEAARIVTGATKLVSISSLLSETGWKPLALRRRKHKLTLFYKMINGFCPGYLCSLVLPTVKSASSYSLRNAANLQTIHSNTQQYFNSFLPSAIREKNDLPLVIRDSTTVTAFKYKLNSNLTQPPSLFHTGNRIGQIYHSRLRTNCSSLNSHLFSKNIIDSPLCICGAIEDTSHYLFVCTRYLDLRQDLINAVPAVCEPTLSVLLYGNTELSYEQNKEVFLSVQNYIVKSKRFQIQ